MIDPLARGVDPVQLAFQSLASMGARTQPTRIESPLAVALQQLGVDLAHAEPFTTAEAKQFVSLVRATLEVIQTAAPADQPAPRVGALLETTQVAMRDLQRVVTEALTEHRHLTTSLAPLLRQLLVAVAMQEPATLSPGLRTAVPARFFLDYPRAPVVSAADRTMVTEPPPTLARLVSSLVESIARLQAVLPLDAVPTAGAERATAPTAPVPVPVPVALPATTARLLQTLVEVIADLLTLLPRAATPAPAVPAAEPPPMEALVRTLREAVALILEVVPVTAGHPGEAVARVADHVPPSTPPPTIARLVNSVAQVIALVHELLSSHVVAEAPAPPAPPAKNGVDSPPRTAASVADPSPTLAPKLADLHPRLAASLADLAPVLAASPGDLPPLLAASLAEVIARLKAGLPAAVLATVVDESAPPSTGTLLAQLQAAAARTAPPAGWIGAQVNPPELFDAYRWGLLAALNYRQSVGRPSQARVSVARPRCEMCNRLLEQTRSGALVCPTC